MNFSISSLLGLLLLFLSCCSSESFRLDHRDTLLEQTQYETSSTAGNFVTSAIRESDSELDIVLYPSALIRSGQYAYLKNNPSQEDIKDILKLYPREGPRDEFLVGRIRGKALKKFLKERIQSFLNLELQSDGLYFHVHHKGGMLQYSYFNDEHGKAIEDERYYRVALSHFYYSIRHSFPGYFYGNGLNSAFVLEEKVISARDAMMSYLSRFEEFPNFERPRARVSHYKAKLLGEKRISEIQGRSHVSPLVGSRVKTRGIVTAVGKSQYWPRDYDVYIQSVEDDDDPRSSEGIALHFPFHENIELKLGDEVSLEGIVCEETSGGGMTGTTLRKIRNLEILSRNNALPRAELIGLNGRKIPRKVISSHRGDLHQKELLNLNEGIGFWESLEGMRVAIQNPRIAGYRGGKEEIHENRAKRHLSLYLVPEMAEEERDSQTPAGGILLRASEKDFNPEIMHLSANHLGKGISVSGNYNIGDFLEGRIEGILYFEKNLFGDGEYLFSTPQAPDFELLGDGFVPVSSRDDQGPLQNVRPHTTLESSERQLTVSTFNVENLAGNQEHRISLIAQSISQNLRCPDIVALVEIQDFNGSEMEGGASAQSTLDKLISKIDCSAENALYRSVNIDPLPNLEGGEPGSNIRVAYIYNSQRLRFEERGQAGPLTTNRVSEDGTLVYNPGRVFPDSEAFKNTRRSLAAEFEFLGEKVILVANHFKSKLGDSSHWGRFQPPVFHSTKKRSAMATKINEFVRHLHAVNPDRHVIVLGDFNSTPSEESLKILSGNYLVNLMNLLDPKDRYTTNYNGNSQSLDHIFVSDSLMEKNPEFEILHLNSDFMGRLSDHDPLISRFTF